MSPDLAEHFGQLQAITVRQEELEDRSADDGHRLVLRRRAMGFLDAVGHIGALRRPLAVAGQDDVPSTWKQPGRLSKVRRP